jgi:hypothetical protein
VPEAIFMDKTIGATVVETIDPKNKFLLLFVLLSKTKMKNETVVAIIIIDIQRVYFEEVTEQVPKSGEYFK